MSKHFKVLVCRKRERVALLLFKPVHVSSLREKHIDYIRRWRDKEASFLLWSSRPSWLSQPFSWQSRVSEKKAGWGCSLRVHTGQLEEKPLNEGQSRLWEDFRKSRETFDDGCDEK
jgi:hypothetical protein